MDYISGLMKEIVNKGIGVTRNFQASVLELVGVILGRTLALPEQDWTIMIYLKP